MILIFYYFFYSSIIQQLESTGEIYNHLNPNKIKIKIAYDNDGYNFHRCKHDTDIVDALMNEQLIYESKNTQFYKARITPDGKEYAFKLFMDDGSSRTDINREMKYNQYAMDDSTVHSLRYYGCYIQFINNKDWYVLQFDVMYDTLEQQMIPIMQNGERAFKILKEGSYYADITDKTVHTRNFSKLFETISFFHYYGFYVKNVLPSNIITNKPIKTLTEDQYDDFKLYFINYRGIDQRYLINKFQANDLDHNLFVHPGVYKQIKYKLENDVYGLCLSYFIIMGHFNLFIVSLIEAYTFNQVRFTSHQDELTNLKPIAFKQVKKFQDLIYNKFVKKTKTQDQLYTEYLAILYEVYKIDQPDEFYYSHSDIIEKRNPVIGSQFGTKIAELCDYETNCIMYLGIQQDYTDIPLPAGMNKALRVAYEVQKERQKQANQKNQDLNIDKKII